MTRIVGNVTGQIFTFSELKEKLRRETTRLKAAEETGNSEDALDHALNAAFTAYHLIELKEKDQNPASQVKARDLLSQSSNPDLNLLHDVVTKTKHVTVSSSATSGQNIDVRTSAVSSETLESFAHTKIEEVAQYSMNSVIVKFEDKRARNILENILKFFS